MIEIGLTRYADDATPEAPHGHKRAFEFQYATAGLTAYLDLGTGGRAGIQKG